MSNTLFLGISDRVIITETIGPDEKCVSCISGTVFSIQNAWENKGYLGGPYVSEVFVQFVDPNDYKKIIRNQKGWPIYCDVLGIVQKSFISVIVDHDHFRVLPDGNPGLCGYLGPRCSYHNICAILISTRTFTIVPVHAVDHATKRITITINV